MNHSKKQLIYFIFLLTVFLSAVLRLLWLDRFPPSLYTDEADQGYNAYSILKTGRDEHGAFLPVSFRSFGDWKPPLPTYLIIPFIALFDLTEQAIRLPSAILGIGTVLLSFYLVKELFNRRKDADYIALLTCFFLAISPWHILQSRAAMLVIVGLFFLEGGIYFFIKGINNSKFIYLSSIFFCLSIYAYYGLRVVTPLIVLILVFFSRKRLTSLLRELFFSALLGMVLLLPLFISLSKTPDVLFGRAKTVSVFYDQGVKLRQWELITQDGINSNPLISRLFHNNLYMYGRSIIQRFLSHFDVRFLFITGDQAQPFQIPNMGILYLMDGIFILLGLIILFRQKGHAKQIVLCWLLLAIVPAAFTFMTPSSNRTFNMIIPLVSLTSLGLVYSLKRAPFKLISIIAVSTIYSLSFAYFLHQYFIVLPIKYADWWNYGWKEVMTYIKTKDLYYKDIVVSDIAEMPYIYFLFYNKYPPEKYQREAVRTYVADRFGFEHVEGFAKYWFPNDFNWQFTKDNLQTKTMYVVPVQQATVDNDYIKAIYYPNGKIAFKIFAYE